MGLVSLVCPQCGGQAQIEAGRSAMCPYCGKELNTSLDRQSFAYAADPAFGQDMQFAQDTQFAPPPAQQMQQPMQMQQPDAMPLQQMQTGQMMQQMPQYSPAMLAEAQNKRKNWYVMNSALIGLQTLMLALGILLEESGTRFGVPLILTWVLTLPGFGALSGLFRPDDAYIDRKPYCKSKFKQGITQFWMSAAISAGAGGILFAILAGLLGML
ncbi:MAG: hypothetical protein IJL32_09495 [Oscillospiraceae bacterium]|nr:hypothetical protein [Oscillospiraceae bacterium]